MIILLSLFATLVVETAVLLFILKEQKKSLVVACSVFASTLTHGIFFLLIAPNLISIPLIHIEFFVYPFFVLSYEIFVVVAEGAIFKILLEKISWGKALLASLAANFTSFVLGIIFGFLP
ncbi:MAG: hypothetical protein QXT25_03905 [Candidatus Anstonellaceae archaeon]